MARGKHAAALFEVIHSGRHTKSRMSTPSWWFKRKNGRSAEVSAIAAAATAMHDTTPTPFDSTDPTLGVDESTFSHRGSSSHAVCGVRSSTRETVSPLVDEEPSHLNSEDSFEETDVPTPFEATAKHIELKPAAIPVAVDGDRKLITFRLSYNNAAVATFAVIVAVALAFMVGKKLGGAAPLSVADESSEQLRGKPAHPNVLNLPPTASASRTIKTNDSSVVREPETGLTSRQFEANDHAMKKEVGAPGAPVDRQIGLNYVVIQSFTDEKMANDIREAFSKAGVPCSIEKGIRGLPATRFCVVGTEGFARIKAVECIDYCKKIDSVSDQLAATKKGFNAQQLMALKWEKPKGA